MPALNCLFIELSHSSVLQNRHKIPPRNLISLAQRYHNKITLQPLMAEASTIALLQPPPSRCLASYIDSDWVVKQKLREEHGIKMNRHQRKNRFKLVNTDVEYQGDDEMMITLKLSRDNNPETTRQNPASKAIIASGTGPDGRAEERKRRKRRKMMVRSVAVLLLSIFAVTAKSYFSSPAGDKPPAMPQRQDVARELQAEKDAPVTIRDVSTTGETCQDNACNESNTPASALKEEAKVAEANALKHPKAATQNEKTAEIQEDASETATCVNNGASCPITDEVSRFFLHQV